MTAYVLFVVEEEHNSEKMKEYRTAARGSLQSRNARLLTLPSSKKKCIEGDDAETIILIEFPSMEEAEEWYYSDEYQKPAKIRQSATSGKAFIIEGTGL